MIDTGSWIAFRYLLERCGPERQEVFTRYLSDDDRKHLSNIHSLAENPFKTSLPLHAKLHAIHYSWFIPFLESLPPSDKECFISAFDPSITTKLMSHFNIKPPLPSLSSRSKHYFQQTLLSWITSDSKDFIPVSLLPPHPLNSLLDLTKSDLQQLVNLLGLRDLATEVKHIVRKDQLKHVQHALSQREKEELKKLLVHPPPPIFPSLNLEQWDGNESTLQKILHHRGFNRLSKALFGCHPALLWHLCHRLDIGRAKIMHRFLTDVKNPTLKETLTTQAIEAIATIKQVHE